ncbi:Two-component sensor histidine kinase [Dissulfuribacter thermophilus]|uniref:histidine kinase n=1 Tax=Dissulfuribacter thermophilus TaxID=1156395 RepID=A0A1B9F896_9BACT|nr:ATP-binding protein [Dissulfuribacter thermophilus]OCC16157.1 Two-component sensor histidine kinase [Dissulfuribacter thermophilus]
MNSIFQFSIKKQIIFLNIMILSFFVIIFGVFYWEIVSFEKRLETIEFFNRILHNSLEIRRYEKDIFLRVGEKNLDKLMEYLSRLKKGIEIKRNDIIQLTNEEEFIDFLNSLNRYEHIFTNYKKNGHLNQTLVRKHGKRIIEFCNKILNRTRVKIHKELKYILWSFMLIPTILGLIMAFLIQFQTKPIIERLKILEKATKDLLEDRFEPIKDDSRIRDEVSDLILAFNKMAQELDTRYEEVLQAKKLAAIGTFSSGIAHELNNPLNNISLSADYLYEEYEELSPEEAREIIKDIMQQAERASKIVKNLLDFSREKESLIKELRIRDIIDNTEKLIDNELKINQIYFGTDIPDNLPPVLGDMDKLQQVFLNLFLNSIQSMKESGGIIYVDAREEPKGYIRIDVTDSGKGIPEEMLDKIFDPFFTTKKVGEGTGLGLSIVYGIIKKHGGHIEVKSKVGEGTTFSIFLPVPKKENSGANKDESGNNRR